MLPEKTAKKVANTLTREVESGYLTKTGEEFSYFEACARNQNSPRKFWWVTRREDLFNENHPMVRATKTLSSKITRRVLENRRKFVLIQEKSDSLLGTNFTKPIRERIKNAETLNYAKVMEKRKVKPIVCWDSFLANNIPQPKTLPKFYSEDAMGRRMHGKVNFIDGKLYHIINPSMEKAEALKELNRKRSITWFKGWRNEISVGDICDDMLGFFKGSVFDFSIPASAEFRSIVELYSFVVSILLAIFVVLICSLIYAVIKTVRRAIDWLEPKLMHYPTYERCPPVYTWVRSKVLKMDIFNTLWWLSIVLDKPYLGPTIVRMIRIVKINKTAELQKLRTALIPEIFYVYYSKVEFTWTSWPVYVLLFISLPSFTLALALDESHKPQNWLKVIANQWYWIYEYSNFTEVEDDYSVGVIYSNIVQGEDLRDESLRLLEPDTMISLPVNQFSRILVTSNDVIHSWAIPSMGVKVDACPGRINALTVLPTRAGVYYGQCSEICGVNHAFMPICVEVTA